LGRGSIVARVAAIDAIDARARRRVPSRDRAPPSVITRDGIATRARADRRRARAR
jgi:hypothetical protein